jgi:hypothetical protein
MPHILELMAGQMNQQEPTQQEPTEKSQIVVMYGGATNTVILRFSSLKKGQQEHVALKKAWKLWHKTGDSASLHDVNGDMFVSTVNLSSIEAISFVDHKKRAKFIPA